MMDVFDPITNEAVADGERGEFVVTDLMRETHILCRWFGEDVGFRESETCPCGRTLYRIKCIGRRDWLTRFKGRIYTPYDLEEDVLRTIPETMAAEYYVTRYADDMSSMRLSTTYDKTTVKTDEDRENLKKKLSSKIKEKFGVDSEIEFVKDEDLPRAIHKVIHVVDEKKE